MRSQNHYLYVGEAVGAVETEVGWAVETEVAKEEGAAEDKENEEAEGVKVVAEGTEEEEA